MARAESRKATTRQMEKDLKCFILDTHPLVDAYMRSCHDCLLKSAVSAREVIRRLLLNALDASEGRPPLASMP